MNIINIQVDGSEYNLRLCDINKNDTIFRRAVNDTLTDEDQKYIQKLSDDEYICFMSSSSVYHLVREIRGYTFVSRYLDDLDYVDLKRDAEIAGMTYMFDNEIPQECYEKSKKYFHILINYSYIIKELVSQYTGDYSTYIIPLVEALNEDFYESNADTLARLFHEYSSKTKPANPSFSLFYAYASSCIINYVKNQYMASMASSFASFTTASFSSSDNNEVDNLESLYKQTESDVNSLSDMYESNSDNESDDVDEEENIALISKILESVGPVDSKIAFV